MNQCDPLLDAEQLREQLLGRLVTTLSQFLACELENLVTDRADHADGERACPVGQSAEADRLRDLAEALCEDDLPF